jgi:Zn-dependent protease with chaperone function
VIIASISVVEIIVLVGLVVIALLFAGGMLAVSRRREKLSDTLLARIEAADAALADARAQDKGWERATIEAAARAAVAPREVRELQLVQVVDRPGTDADQAVFRVVGADGAESAVTLGRRDGVWGAV